MALSGSDELPTLRLFRDRIKFALDRVGMGPSEFARQISSSPQNVQNMLTRSSPTYRGARLFKMAQVLDVPAEWLGGDEAVTAGAGRLSPPASTKNGSHLVATAGLSALQIAGIEALATVMRSGAFTDEEVIDLLNGLKPRLTKLKSA